MQTRRSAVISFVRPETEPELFGWYLSIGETVSSARTDAGFSIFIDPLKSPRAVYSRQGKTPGEKRLQLDCTLYINPGTNSPVEQEIIDSVLKPFIRENSQGIGARITFDGENFEIQEYPATHGNKIIFRGKIEREAAARMEAYAPKVILRSSGGNGGLIRQTRRHTHEAYSG
jgi:hypothetical protein